MEYLSDGFLEKNRDTVYEEHINILKASKVSNTGNGTGRVTPWGNACLLVLEYLHRALSSIPSTIKIEMWELGVVTYACYSRTLEVEARGLLQVKDQSDLHSKF